jgi:hypothetical protein
VRAVLLAGLLVLAWPAAASAVTYGGGTPTADYRLAPRQMTLVGISTETTGQARVWVEVATRCGLTPAAPTPVTLNPDGSFAFRRTVRGRPGGGPLRTARIRMAGVVAGNAASGTVSVKLSLRRRGRVTAKCSSGTRNWQARMPAPLGPPSTARPNTVYYGFTSQAGDPRRPFPVVFQVDGTGGRIVAVTFRYRLRCRSGMSYELDDVTPAVPVAADGTFHLRERFWQHYANGDERYRVTLDGRFQTDGMSGGLHVTSVLRSRRTGRVIDRCSTGSGQSLAATF